MPSIKVVAPRLSLTANAGVFFDILTTLKPRLISRDYPFLSCSFAPVRRLSALESIQLAETAAKRQVSRRCRAVRD